MQLSHAYFINRANATSVTPPATWLIIARDTAICGIVTRLAFADDISFLVYATFDINNTAMLYILIVNLVAIYVTYFSLRRCI